jgi:hypothetical protein
MSQCRVAIRGLGALSRLFTQSRPLIAESAVICHFDPRQALLVVWVHAPWDHVANVEFSGGAVHRHRRADGGGGGDRFVTRHPSRY